MKHLNIKSDENPFGESQSSKGYDQVWTENHHWCLNIYDAADYKNLNTNHNVYNLIQYKVYTRIMYKKCFNYVLIITF
jgi:hypothetical protein